MHCSAVALLWSRSLKRFERQGILVEDAALVQAEQECLADADLRLHQPGAPGERKCDLCHRRRQAQ